MNNIIKKIKDTLFKNRKMIYYDKYINIDKYIHFLYKGKIEKVNEIIKESIKGEDLCNSKIYKYNFDMVQINYNYSGYNIKYYIISYILNRLIKYDFLNELKWNDINDFIDEYLTIYKINNDLYILIDKRYGKKIHKRYHINKFDKIFNKIYYDYNRIKTQNKLNIIDNYFIFKAIKKYEIYTEYKLITSMITLIKMIQIGIDYHNNMIYYYNNTNTMNNFLKIKFNTNYKLYN